MPKIFFDDGFQKQFKKLSVEEQRRILKKLKMWEKDVQNVDIKKLHPQEKNFYRLRVGKFRIVFCYRTRQEVVLLQVDSRDKIYKV